MQIDIILVSICEINILCTHHIVLHAYSDMHNTFYFSAIWTYFITLNCTLFQMHPYTPRSFMFFSGVLSVFYTDWSWRTLRYFNYIFISEMTKLNLKLNFNSAQHCSVDTRKDDSLYCLPNSRCGGFQRYSINRYLTLWVSMYMCRRQLLKLCSGGTKKNVSAKNNEYIQCVIQWQANVECLH